MVLIQSRETEVTWGLVTQLLWQLCREQMMMRWAPYSIISWPLSNEVVHGKLHLSQWKLEELKRMMKLGQLWQ
jgi:hypothetical protein